MKDIIQNRILMWERKPERTFISRDEKSAPGCKVSEERLTLLLAGNASGDFNLKLLLVYMSETPRALKGMEKSSYLLYGSLTRRLGRLNI